MPKKREPNPFFDDGGMQPLFDLDALSQGEQVQANNAFAVHPIPEQVFEQIDNDSKEAGGSWELSEAYEGAVGRTMFDLPTSEDNTITILLPRDQIAQAPSQSLIRIKSVHDRPARTYLGIVVKGPFAEPDGLRGDTPIMITTAVRGGIFMPRFHGRVQVELLGEELENGTIIPPRLRPLPNSPVFVLDKDETARTLRLGGDISIGVPVGYEDITAAVPSTTKSVLPRHLGILGTTGGGKSTTVSGLISGFQQANIATVVIDTEGEYTQIYEPTEHVSMLQALKQRGRSPQGVANVHVYHLVGRETTCPDEEHVAAFSLQFSQLSPYLVMEILGLTEAQEQRYLKAYDIAKLILSRLHVFPKTQQDMQMLLEIDEMEVGYPKMRLEHMYDVVQAYAMLAALEGTRTQRGNARTQTSFDFTTINFRSSEFKDAKEQVAAILEQEKDMVPGNVGSWRVIQGHLGRLLRANLFDNGGAKPLNYNDLTMPGQVSIIDLSDVDSPYMNNLVIAELLRGLLDAQNSNYEEATKQGKEQRRTMVIIEEAHEFLSSERIRQMPMLFQQVARIARRGRKRWFGLVFVTQLPQHLPDEVLGLINNYILHKISDANVISRLKRSLGVIDDSLWKRLPSLAPGQALVSMSNFARPLLVNIDPTPCKLRMIE